MENQDGSDSIGGRARKAAGWQFLSKGINTGLRIVTSIVLARLLMPDDFGIVALATMVTGLAAVFRNLGLGQALVQRPEIEDRHINSAFWGTLTMGAVLCGIMVLISPWVGNYFNEPRMIPVLQVAALSFIISPFSVVPRSLLQRNLDFRTMFFAESAGSAAYGAAGITMALVGYGYWSLVGAQLGLAVISGIVFCILTRYLPPIIPRFGGIGDLFGFGAGVTGVGFMNYVATRVDYFVIGRKLNTDTLGLYTKAYQIITFPLSLVSLTLYPILFSAFSQMQDDLPRAQRAFKRALTTVATITWPLLAGLLVTAPELIPTVLGEQWTEAVVLLQILIGAGVVKTIANPCGAISKAMGTRYVYGELWRQGVYALLLGAGTWLATDWGIEGVSWAVVMANTVALGLSIHLAWIAAGIGLRDHLVALRGPMVTFAGVSGLCYGARYLALANEISAALTLAITVVVGAAATFLLSRFNPFREVRSSYDDIIELVRRRTA